MFNFLRKRIGIIGYGNMGLAIASRLSGKYYVVVFDKDKSKTQNLVNIQVASSLLDLVKKADVVILAVKPQDLGAVLNEIKHDLKTKLIISIAAGITTGYIENILGDCKVIRAMPNLPVRIGKGMICFSKGRFAEQKDLTFSLRLFKNLGRTMEIEEKLMNDVTAASGSGPAFFYDFIEKQKNLGNTKLGNIKKEFDKIMVDYLLSHKCGWTPQDARVVVTTTSAASLALLKIENVDPKDLIIQIASPGGTTQAGLDKLDNKGTLTDAMDAAIKRAEELSKN
ncbi:MAG: pyrroline-5-carboxylate reductase [Candidatus Omnitrophota bacterium]